MRLPHQLHLYYQLPGLLDGQACPVFQATSGHPAKPLPIRASGLHWSSGHPGPALTCLANLRPDKKIRFHSLSGSNSAVTPVWVQCRVQKIIIEYQNALSPVLLSSLQLFASLLSLALSRQCSAFQVPRSWLLVKTRTAGDISRYQLHRKYSTVKILQMRRNREDLASVKNFKILAIVKFFKCL